MERLYLLYIVFSLFLVLCGAIEILFPAWLLEVQKSIYLKLNWIITPVNEDIEIRNTRIAGLLMVVIAALTLLIVWGYYTGWLA